MNSATNIKSYVLRKGKMSKGQRLAYENYFEKYCIPFRKDIDIKEYLSWQNSPLIIEIGFGMGHATEAIAQKFPDKKFIGIEVHKPGVGSLLKKIHDREIPNLRIVSHDAVEVLEFMVTDASLAGVHIFFPDPWPKKRHHKRRLIQPDFLELVSTKLCTGGYLYAVTDWEEYGLSILDAVERCSSVTNPYSGFSPPVEWRPGTNFEKKGLAKDHRICEIYCTKL